MDQQVLVTTLAGNGTGAFADGSGAVANFYRPYVVAVDTSGNVYVADYSNHRIRKLKLADGGCPAGTECIDPVSPLPCPVNTSCIPCSSVRFSVFFCYLPYYFYFSHYTTNPFFFVRCRGHIIHQAIIPLVVLACPVLLVFTV